MKEYLLILFVFNASVTFGQKTSTETYDMVVLNGCVIDPETMFYDVANMGIKVEKNAIIIKSKIKESNDAIGCIDQTNTKNCT